MIRLSFFGGAYLLKILMFRSVQFSLESKKTSHPLHKIWLGTATGDISVLFFSIKKVIKTYWVEVAVRDTVPFESLIPERSAGGMLLGILGW